MHPEEPSKERLVAEAHLAVLVAQDALRDAEAKRLDAEKMLYSGAPEPRTVVVGSTAVTFTSDGFGVNRRYTYNTSEVVA